MASLLFNVVSLLFSLIYCALWYYNLFSITTVILSAFRELHILFHSTQHYNTDYLLSLQS